MRKKFSISLPVEPLICLCTLLSAGIVLLQNARNLSADLRQFLYNSSLYTLSQSAPDALEKLGCVTGAVGLNDLEKSIIARLAKSRQASRPVAP